MLFSQKINEDVRKDILNVLRNAITALETKNSVTLRDLSDTIIHSASIFQDEASITTAVVIYALAKIINREAEIEPETITLLENAKLSLERNRVKRFMKNIKKIITHISKKDAQLNLYIQEVINEAQIKKGSKIYYHGISLAQTAEILGISQWELMNYIGKTKIIDQFEEKINVGTRLDFTRALFKAG